MNATVEDSSARETRQRRRNRTTLAWLSAVLLVLMTLGYFFGRWIMKHPPAPGH